MRVRLKHCACGRVMSLVESERWGKYWRCGGCGLEVARGQPKRAPVGVDYLPLGRLSRRIRQALA
jgi:hypothetical protein